MILYKEHIFDIPASEFEKNGVPHYLNEYLGSDEWIVILITVLPPSSLGQQYKIIALAWKHFYEYK